MVYVVNGQVYESAPWGLQRILKVFTGIITFVMLFFKSMVGLDTTTSTTGGFSRGSGDSRNRGTWGGGGGGGGGGGPYGPGGGGGSGPRFRTMRDINPPTVGGCPGGSCGM